jgi:hypothetical protein
LAGNLKLLSKVNKGRSEKEMSGGCGTGPQRLHWATFELMAPAQGRYCETG